MMHSWKYSDLQLPRSMIVHFEKFLSYHQKFSDCSDNHNIYAKIDRGSFFQQTPPKSVHFLNKNFMEENKSLATDKF